MPPQAASFYGRGGAHGLIQSGSGKVACDRATTLSRLLIDLLQKPLGPLNDSIEYATSRLAALSDPHGLEALQGERIWSGGLWKGMARADEPCWAGVSASQPEAPFHHMSQSGSPFVVGSSSNQGRV